MMNRLSSFYDISGRVTKETIHDKFFTVGGVILPSLNEDRLRAAIPKGFPKWKYSTLESLSIITQYIDDYDIYCTAVKIEKSQPCWGKFWEFGKRQYNDLSSRTKGNIGFAKAGTLMKALVINKCSAIGLGLYLKSKGKPEILDSNGLSILSLRVVCDTDIEGQDNQEAFKDYFEIWSKKTKLISMLGIRPYIDKVEFCSEQQERLLSIPDCIAGCFYYKSNPEGSKIPVSLNHSDVDKFFRDISGSHRFKQIDYKFDESFPNLTSL